MVPLSLNITEFLEVSLKSKDLQIYQLAGDASARKYYRIICQNKTYVLMSWEAFDEATYPFLNVLQHFKFASVNVPDVIAVDSLLGVILLEDLGDLTVERKFWESTETEHSWGFYQKAVDELIKIHVNATQKPNPSISYNIAKTSEFDIAKFMWEMNYAKTHLIDGLLSFQMNEKTRLELDAVFLKICEKLYREPQVICHRDYHSRNLMIKLDKVFVIDFQDARRGPVQYDLVSLTKDSYVDISEDYENKILNYYFEKSDYFKKLQTDKDHFYNVYEAQTIQRCFKACGSFSSFMNTRQDKRYLKYLPSTLKRVIKALRIFPEYQLLSNILIDSGALEKSYAQM